MKKKKKMNLVTTVAIACLFLGLAITAGCCVIGYFRYTSVMEKLYNDKAYEIAYSAMNYVDGDMVEAWYKELRNAKDKDEIAAVSEKIMAYPEYQQILDIISDLRQNMNANYIYIADQTDGNGIVTDQFLYMMDADNPDDAFPPFIPGDTGKMNPDFLDDSRFIYSTGQRCDNYFYSHSAFGYNTSAIAAIKNSKGQVVAVMGVEIAMKNIQSARRDYIVSTVAFSLVFMILLILIYMLIVRKMILKPLELITKETETFVSKDAAVSDKLGSIKTNNEIETLADSILQMEISINKYIDNLTYITAEKERISTELNVATNIQASMLPSHFPAFPEHEEFDIYATMTPAKEVGGDFYDFFMVDDTHIAIVAADVSGKGVPAALFMVIGKTLIKDHVTPEVDLGSVFTDVNNLLCESNSGELFITAFVGVLDLKNGEFRYVNAGHETPFICRAGGKFEPYKIKAGFVLAGMEDIRYRYGVVQLNPGDKIFQYTDGVTEATNAHNELYGMERLEKLLAEVSDKTPNEILPALKKDIDIFVGEAPQFDDITMICLDFKKFME